MDDNRELLIGIAGVVAFGAGENSFTLRHILLGAILLLFLFERWGVVRSTYSQVLFALVAGCCCLLICGYPIDLALQYFKKAHFFQEAFVVTWIVFSVIVFVARRFLGKRRKENVQSA